MSSNAYMVDWRLDRLGRTAREMLTLLRARGRWRRVSLRPGPRRCPLRDRTSLMRTILAGFAEYEREVISERVRAGISRARAEGNAGAAESPGSALP